MGMVTSVIIHSESFGRLQRYLFCYEIWFPFTTTFALFWIVSIFQQVPWNILRPNLTHLNQFSQFRQFEAFLPIVDFNCPFSYLWWHWQICKCHYKKNGQKLVLKSYNGLKCLFKWVKLGLSMFYETYWKMEAYYPKQCKRCCERKPNFITE